MLFRADRDLAQLADNRGVTLIVRVHGHGAVAEHGFRPCRGDGDIVALFLQRDIPVLVLLDISVSLTARERVFEMPHMAFHIPALDFEVGDGRLEVRIPVHQPLVAVDETFIVEVDKDLADRFLHLVVGVVPVAHGEALILPVAGGAEAFQLLDDLSAGLFLPLPDAVDEGLAAQAGAALVSVLGKLALDHHLRGDTGMVRARLPADILAAHTLKPDKDILKRVVEGVAHMQDAGDVWRRDDDRIGLRTRIAGGAEASRLFPALIDAPFGALRIEALVKHLVGPSLSVRNYKRKGAPFRARLVSISGCERGSSAPCGRYAVLLPRPCAQRWPAGWHRAIP